MGTFRIFVACAPGLESLLTQELAELGAPGPESTPGGAYLDGDLETLYRLHLWSGVASQVRVRLARFDARHFSALAKQAARVDWKRWLAPGATVRVKATSKRSKLYHTGGIEQRVREAVDAVLGCGTDDSGPVIHARIVRDRCELSLDTCGEPLHRRGWRQQTAKAPLREDLAHALLRLSGWTPTMTLVDPMMGSGTLVIEAARMARRIAPGRDRSFAFESMPNFDAGLWTRLREQAAEQEQPMPIRVVGRDRERGALEAAKGNAGRARVGDDLELEQAELSARELDSEAVVCNPPYGKRVGADRSVRGTWMALGQAVAQSLTVRTVGIVVPDRSLLRGTQLGVEARLLTDHGGIKVEFMTSPRPRGQDSRSRS